MKDNLKQQIWDQSKEWINAIGNVVNEMAKQLGVGAEHVYRVYTKQIFVEGLIYTIASLIVMIAVCIIVPKIYKWTDKWRDRHGDWSEGRAFACIIGTVAGLALFFGMLFGLFVPGLMKVMNPEYYTMKDLLETVKGLMK